jgi:HAE1 family hydrophobic/amphiphilic exporter-1
MWFTLAAIKRPVAMTMVFVALGFLGVLAWFKLPKQLFPDTEIPVMSVSSVYPGAGAEEVERLIVEPIEDAVSTISNVDTVQSTAIEGLGYVIIIFDANTDQEAAASDVRDRVAAIVGVLPDDAETPVVQKFDMSSMPTLVIGTTSEHLSNRELRAVTDNAIKDRIAGAVGVATVEISGGDVREVQIKVRPDRLMAIGMSLRQFQMWLAAQSIDLPGGSFKEGEKHYSVRMLGEFQSVDEIRQLRIRTADGGLIELRDVADVTDSVAEVDSYARLNGLPSVAISVTKTTNANIIETAEAVKARISALEASLPGDVQFTYVSDDSDYTKESLHDLQNHLMYGVLLATLVVFLFLRNLRATLIIFVAIPTSLLATFFVMNIINYTLNFLTMLGLSLAVGILVDDSIVVLENIYRHLAMGKPPEQAAIDGRIEIGLAAVAITMVDVVVFIPIAMMGGMMGKFFRPFGLTVATATLFSLFVSFTLTPMLASRWLRTSDAAGSGDEEDRTEAVLRARGPYVRLLDFCVRRWWGRLTAVLAGFLLTAAILVGIMPTMGSALMADSDQGQLSVYIELPIDKNIDATDRITRQVEEIVAGIPEIEAYSTEVGNMGRTRGPNYAQISVKCYDRAPKGKRMLASMRGIGMLEGREGAKERVREVGELCTEIETAARESITGAIVRARRSSSSPGGSDINPLSVEIVGTREMGLVEMAERVRERLSAEPGWDAMSSHQAGKPEMQARVDRVRAAALGLSTAEIAMALRMAVEGDTTLEYRELGDEYDIRIEFGDEYTDATRRLPEIVIGMNGGVPIRLRDVATVEEGAGPAQLTRRDRLDVITVGVNPGGDSTGEASEKIREIMKEFTFPPGMNYQLGGSSEIMTESFGYILESLTISVVLVFALLTILFESWFHPLTLMTCTPMAITGAILGLKIAGCILDIFGMIGIILLIGIVSKNSILLVDYANTLRREGFGRTDAVIRAGITRFRPIMMTTLTLAMSLLPISTGMGRGAETRQSLGASVTGGILFATFVSLVVVPSFYCWMDDLQRGYVWLKRKLTGYGAHEFGAAKGEGEEKDGSETGGGVGEA